MGMLLKQDLVKTTRLIEKETLEVALRDHYDLQHVYISVNIDHVHPENSIMVVFSPLLGGFKKDIRKDDTRLLEGTLKDWPFPRMKHDIPSSAGYEFDYNIFQHNATIWCMHLECAKIAAAAPYTNILDAGALYTTEMICCL
jgi:hypothetical protein